MISIKFNEMNKIPFGVSFVFLVLILAQPSMALAATTPSLGVATTFGILGSTYTNTAAGTVINGDLGYTTGPAMVPTVNGVTHMADVTYTQAGVDQGSALSNLNAQACDFNFSSPTDLSLLTQPLTPGVYCISAATSVGTSGITLDGNGTYIFRINGALTTVADSSVSLTGGATACDVFWTPTSATTLGANSSFAGTVISVPGITVGSSVTWAGRALAFGGTVTTDLDTITVPTCSSVVPPVVTPPVVTPPVVTPPVDDTINPDVNPVVSPETSTVLPITGLAPWDVIALFGMLLLVSTTFVVAFRKTRDSL